MAVIITIELKSEDQAEALATFCKHVGFKDCRDHARSDKQANDMVQAHYQVSTSLAKAGYYVR